MAADWLSDRLQSIAWDTQSLAEADVTLVSAPYAALQRPSLALGLLKQLLQDAGIRTQVVYANLWFAARIGLSRYQLCTHQCPTDFLAGEWTFAEVAFRDAGLDDDGYLRCLETSHFRVGGFGDADTAQRLVDELRSVRGEATGFINEAAERILATRPKIVGCTSTFEQQVASLALLRRIRELAPDVITMLGGANCETVMGQTTHRCFPWVDYVVSGEADGLIAELVQRVLAEGREIALHDLPLGVFGPRHRDQLPISGEKVPRARYRDLDQLPLPDFDDYFRTLGSSPMADAITPGLPLETSRGCWWGDAHHCTFCGLNGTAMGYRSKSPERVLSEIHDLETRYGISTFEAVDNILDMSYLRTVMPRLRDERWGGQLFYEVKANLRRDQVELLSQAGVTWMQPGIESLHSDVLRLMDKGVQAWQNVQLLKWAREFGVRMTWSILWGFPGEEDAWYLEMARLLPWLEHLQPPGAMVGLRYDRYSVYHNRAEEMGLDLRPIPAMKFIYPVDAEELENLAYFFTAGEGAPGQLGMRQPTVLLNSRPGLTAVARALSGWIAGSTSGAELRMEDQEDGTLEVRDSRRMAVDACLRLTGLARAICLASDEGLAEAKLPRIVADRFAIEATETELEETKEDLLRRGIVLRIDGRLVTVAVRSAPAELPPPHVFPGGHVRA